jgi:hypothetical protein
MPTPEWWPELKPNWGFNSSDLLNRYDVATLQKIAKHLYQWKIDKLQKVSHFYHNPSISHSSLPQCFVVGIAYAYLVFGVFRCKGKMVSLLLWRQCHPHRQDHVRRLLLHPLFRQVLVVWWTQHRPYQQVVLHERTQHPRLWV